jgi:hypothetical protein
LIGRKLTWKERIKGRIIIWKLKNSIN